MNLEIEHYQNTHTTDEAVEAMKYYARKESSDNRIISLAHEITDNVDDLRSKILALRNYILQNFRYISDESEAMERYGVKSDEGVEMVKSPIATITSRTYDCDCASTLIASMLISLGIRCRFIVVGFLPEEMTGPDGYSHVFVQGFAEEWITSDPVAFPKEKEMLQDSRQHKIYDI